MPAPQQLAINLSSVLYQETHFSFIDQDMLLT